MTTVTTIAPSAVAFGNGGVVPLRGGFGGTGVSRSVLTDANGQFSFPRLPAGEFSLFAMHSQFLQLVYGQKRTDGPAATIRLTDGQQLNLKAEMLRGGVITGTVYGEDGEPQRNAQVRGLRSVLVNGVRRLQNNGFAQSDDRGVYWLYGLQPGTYVISATPNGSDQFGNDRMLSEMAAIEAAIASGAAQPPAAPGLPPTVSVTITPPAQPMTGPPSQPPGYLPVYAPSSLTPSGAASVDVAGGDERANIDIQLRLAQASQIQGTIAGALEPGVAVQVSLVSDDPLLEGVSNMSTRPDQSGRFTFRTIAPGRYTVFAQTVPAPPTFVSGQPPAPPQAPPQLTAAQKQWGRASVLVEGQSSLELSLPLRPARSISGIIAFDLARVPDLTRIRSTVFLTPAPSARSMPSYSGPPSAQIEPDGSFTLTGVMPGVYTLRTGIGLLKSAVVDGRDTADFPLEFTGDRDVSGVVVTVTDKASELSGTLTNAAGAPALDQTIIVAPTDSRYWMPGSRRISTTRTVAEGRYLIRNLPPGDYLLAVVGDFEQGAQYDPEFLRGLGSGAVRVTITEGGKTVQDLRVR